MLTRGEGYNYGPTINRKHHITHLQSPAAWSSLMSPSGYRQTKKTAVETHVQQSERCPWPELAGAAGGSSFLTPTKTALRLLDPRRSSGWSVRPAGRWNLKPAVWNTELVQNQRPPYLHGGNAACCRGHWGLRTPLGHIPPSFLKRIIFSPHSS